MAAGCPSGTLRGWSGDCHRRKPVVPDTVYRHHGAQSVNDPLLCGEMLLVRGAAGSGGLAGVVGAGVGAGAGAAGVAGAVWDPEPPQLPQLLQPLQLEHVAPHVTPHCE